jgi:pimeloyl-ACP methyl ester carboxylesterase
VIASLQRVIETLFAEGEYDRVVLFGHSGGGTLATLLASRLPEVDALVTIAPNLDVAGWTALHGYSPLAGSLDPARTNDFPRGILQVHWLGSDDREIPPRLIEALEPRLGMGQVRVHDGFDHRCCWRDIWPQQLDELDVYFSRTAARKGDAAAITTMNGRETVRLEENLQ